MARTARCFLFPVAPPRDIPAAGVLSRRGWRLNLVGLRPGHFFIVAEATALLPALLGSHAAAGMVLTRKGDSGGLVDGRRYREANRPGKVGDQRQPDHERSTNALLQGCELLLCCHGVQPRLAPRPRCYVRAGALSSAEISGDWRHGEKSTGCMGAGCSEKRRTSRILREGGILRPIDMVEEQVITYAGCGSCPGSQGRDARAGVSPSSSEGQA